MNVYFISGMGADRRVFQKINLPEKYKIHYLDWISPLKNEKIEDYAQRISQPIDTSKNFAIVGLSFGGAIACEISKFLHPKKIILLSSVSVRKEIPWYFRTAGFFRLYKIPHLKYSKSATRMLCWFLGVKSKDEMDLVKKIKDDSDFEITRWAIARLLHWKSLHRPGNIIHIHGSADRLLPVKYVKADHVIPGGGHFMVYNMYEKVSSLITEILENSDR